MEKDVSLNLHLISWSGSKGVRERAAPKQAGQSAWSLGRYPILALIFEMFSPMAD